MCQPLTITECLGYDDDLTHVQFEMLTDCVGIRPHDEAFHPHISDLRDLRLWLNKAIAENEDFDECEAKADRADPDRD